VHLVEFICKIIKSHFLRNVVVSYSKATFFSPHLFILRLVLPLNKNVFSKRPLYVPEICKKEMPICH